MNYKIGEISISFLVTVFLLTLLEIIATAFIPALGFIDLMLPFNVLLILFLGFRVKTPYLPVLILGIQLFHSMFSVEGWAHGTLTGVIVCIGIGLLKDLIELKSGLITAFVVFVSTVTWYLISSIFFFISVQDFNLVLERFLGGIPESLVLGIISPVFFILLDKIWRVDYHKMMEA